jgi:glycosyltransferase involved in cell wall biosynthesis
MAQLADRATDTRLPIAFVGTYPPRRCGIATFTSDLAQAVAGDPMIVALTDPGGQYEYPRQVGYEIRQGVRADYARAAEFVNYSDVRLVSVQHEHGIFGGEDGAYVLDFLAALRIPALATLHTVLKEPSGSQCEIVRRMSGSCARLVVMSQVAAQLLQRSYNVDPGRIRVVSHGIPEMTHRDPAALKARFGVTGRRLLLTFGLLGPSKGIETVIRALPSVIESFPDVIYFVVGATHPHIIRRDGESYRAFLEREAERLGVRDHVVFRDQFVSTEELCRVLQAADVYLSPYRNEAQVTSGALSYAMGAGTAVVSTPYWHAQELLSGGRGRLFPFGDHQALAKVLLDLLESPMELERLRREAFSFTRSMTWPSVGRAYRALGLEVLTELPLRAVPRRPTRASSLPELRLDHLIRLTDDTGIIQHATFTIPARSSGYCVDDNARALLVALQADRLSGDRTTRGLVSTYLAYLHHAQTPRGDFVNFLSYDRTLASAAGSEDCTGRALWALGATVRFGVEEGQRHLARQMIDRALPHALESGPRGTATAILGLVNLAAMDPDSATLRQVLSDLAGKLVDRYAAEASPDWRWFEPVLTYDNALLPLALFRAFTVTEERATLRVAREALEFLQHACFRDGHLALVGTNGWRTRGEAGASDDEQAVDAAAFVLAFRGAFLATGDHHYLALMRQSFAWFLGANRLGKALYDSVTAGCRDGLGLTEPNQNQGAESTVCFLLALQEMLEVAGEGLEYGIVAGTA